MKVYPFFLFFILSTFYHNATAQSEKILFEGVYLDKAEIIQRQQLKLISTTTIDSTSQKFISTPDIGTLINFDELSAPCLFVNQALPGNTYLPQGLTFSGTWKILNACGSFSVSKFSIPNFLAWNSDATSRVENLIFTSPVKNVSFGIASNYSPTINIKLFNVSNEIIENVNPSVSGTLTYISFTQENISRIEITAASGNTYTVGVLDNLRFTKQCSAENLTLISPDDDYYNDNQLKKAQSIFASNSIVGNTINVVYKAEKAIILTPGFRVNNGAVFQSEIGNCY